MHMLEAKRVVLTGAAGGIGSLVASRMRAHGAHLIAELQRQLGGPQVEFQAGVSYRNLLMYRRAAGLFTSETQTTPPHDLTDQPVAPHQPSGPGGSWLRALMDRSIPILAQSIHGPPNVLLRVHPNVRP